MLVGDIGIGALDPSGEVGAYEKIKNPVHAVGSHAAPLSFRYLFRDVIRARRLSEARQGIKYCRAHFGPLLALARQPVAGRDSQRIAFVKLMVVLHHDIHVMR